MPKPRTGAVAVIGREARAALSETLSAVMLAAADSVIDSSPVQTGHLKSNFILTVGRPFSGVDGSPEAVSHAAQRTGVAAVRKYDVGRDGKIFFVNNVEYLRYLPGFVTKALMAGARAAPRGMKKRARAALSALARTSFGRGA